MPRSVLYVDPDDGDRERFAEAVAPVDGLTTSLAADVETALDLLDEQDFDIIISEIDLDDGEVSELFSRARKRVRPVPCIVFTDKDIDELLQEDILMDVSTFTSKEREDAFEKLVEEVDESVRPRSEIEYPVPSDEESRLRALRELDLERLRDEDAFDRLTRLARAFFDVTYAFVGIVEEDSEQFISFEGADVEDLARECSICTFGILDDEATVIDNSRTDERFKYIDELEELDIVFYAGHPLTTEDGFRIGMFCITDDEPRAFDQEDREYLKLFAEEASELIRLYGGER